MVTTTKQQYINNNNINIDVSNSDNNNYLRMIKLMHSCCMTAQTSTVVNALLVFKFVYRGRSAHWRHEKRVIGNWQRNIRLTYNSESCKSIKIRYCKFLNKVALPHNSADTCPDRGQILAVTAHLFIHSFIHSFIHTFILSLRHSFIHLFTYSLTHSFAQWLIHSFIQSFTHSFIHSLFNDRWTDCCLWL